MWLLVHGHVCVEAQTTDLRTKELPRWTVEEDLRIGDINDPEQILVRPAVVRVDDQGHILIMDPGVPTIWEYSSEGRYVGTVGREGDGPGEYRAPAAMGFLGDTLWVSDATSGRLTLYASDRSVIESIRFNGGGEPRIPVALDAHGDVIAVSPAHAPYEERGTDGIIDFRQHFLRTDRHGVVVDSLDSQIVQTNIIAVDGANRLIRSPFVVRDEPSVGYHEETGLLYELHRPTPDPEDAVARFRIVERDGDGAVLRERTFEDSPRRMDGAVRAELEAEIAENLDHVEPEFREAVEDYLASIGLVPPASGLGRSGGLFWVQREPFQGTDEYLVLDGNLEPKAVLELPAEADAVIGPRTKDYVWARVLGDYEVPYVVRYRIER